MTPNEYQRDCEWLRSVLLDAQERGDYHLEMDVKEKLTTLQDLYCNEEEQ